MRPGVDPSVVPTWRQLFERGEFTSVEEARGALKLAIFQAIAVRETTIAAWTGLSPDEVGCWILDPLWLPEPASPGSTSRAQPFTRGAQRE